ncbi:molybdenum cofactor biosynthesis protein MoaE [Archaeoglobales archaeon]|nr:MAG: molybdenum cofactor biosynthesis protein MoaE [Archaeoglobales archaeon]
MKVFFTNSWDELEGKLKKLGRATLIEKSDDIKSKIRVSISNTTTNVDLRDVLEFLANLGYDFVGLKGFDDASLGIEIKKANTVEEILKLEDFETLNSLIRKIKENEKSEECGAIGIFVGFVRKLSDNKEVLRLEYEKFDEIFDEKLKEIENKLKSYEGVVDVKIYHKSGIIFPKEDIVYVVVMGKHRKDIWEPLKQSMEIIKKELPIWKKEVFIDGEVWVHDKLEADG